MPVLVAPADTPLGVAFVQSLRGLGAEVRAYATGAGNVGALRAAGAYVAVGDLDDEGRLDAAMTDAHTVVALHADPLANDAEVLDAHLRVFLTAARKAEVARLVVRSVPRASGSADPLRAVCASIERALESLPLPTVAVRTSLVDTPALRDAAVSLGTSRIDTDVQVATLHPDDVVDALVALDDARSTMSEGHVVFHLQGRPRTLASYLDHCGEGMVGRVYTPGTKVPLLAPSLRTPWSEREDSATADLMAFAELIPRHLPA